MSGVPPNQGLPPNNMNMMGGHMNMNAAMNMNNMNMNNMNMNMGMTPTMNMGMNPNMNMTMNMNTMGMGMDMAMNTAINNAKAKSTSSTASASKRKNSKANTTTASQKKKNRSKKQKSSATGRNSGANANKQGNLAQVQKSSIMAASKKAERELKQARMEAQARKNDAAWTSSELVAASLNYRNKKKVDVQKIISESKIVENALKANGLVMSDVTPQAYGSLLEYVRRYSLEIYNDALDLAKHRAKNEAGLEIQGRDLKAAVDMRDDSNIISCLPPRNQFMILADQVNKVPLPPIPLNCYNGIVLPPSKENLLTNRTFDVLSASFVRSVMKKKKKIVPTINQNSTTNSSATTGDTSTATAPATQSSHSSYGAKKGPQIPINLKPKEPVPDTSAITDADTGSEMDTTGPSQTQSTVPTTGSTPGAPLTTNAPNDSNATNTSIPPTTTTTTTTAIPTPSSNPTSNGGGAAP